MRGRYCVLGFLAAAIIGASMSMFLRRFVAQVASVLSLSVSSSCFCAFFVVSATVLLIGWVFIVVR